MTPGPDHETVLHQFRQWLDEAQSEAELLAEPPEGQTPETELPQVGLFQLVEQFTSLRHEMKLQTKSARGLEEQAGTMIQALEEAVGQFRTVQPREEQAAQKAARPLVEALVELDEALRRGGTVIDNVGRRMLDQAPAQLHEQLQALHLRRPRWRRWLGRRHYQAIDQLCQQHTQGQREVFQSLREGYRLIQNRLQRALDEQQVARIVCVGQPVDPNRMTVIEVVDAPGQPAGTVLEEVRPGYTWKGKVLRYAEVRAVRAETNS